ncbi:MAG TPA: DUF6404 family protein [Stenotrophomonas sp.]|jgi:hypothetical protein
MMNNVPSSVLQARDYLAAASGGGQPLKSSWLHRFLWRLGVPVPPAAFAGFMANFTLFALGFAIGWSGLMALASILFSGGVNSNLMVVGMLAGSAYGLIRATEAGTWSRQRRIPSWNEFRAGPHHL